MKSVNKVILLGNVGKDPEVKFTPNGTAVAKFTMATNSRYKDQGGEWQERTEWHSIVAWQRLAEIAGEYVKKFTLRAASKPRAGTTNKAAKRNTAPK